MQITIHRGTHEIGGSCVEITGRAAKIVVDIGMPLVKKTGEKFEIEEYAGLKGPELVKEGVLPGIKGFYQWDENRSVDALFLSHAHLDHYGFFKFINKSIPCYMGEGTKRLIDITNYFVRNEDLPFVHNPLKSGTPVQIEDILVTPYLMDHSAFDAYAFAIETEGKSIIYSGDFREHGRKEGAFYWFLNNAPEGIDALLLEGSILGRQSETHKNEREIENDLLRAITQSKGIVLLVGSGQNIDRLVSFYKASFRAKRLFVVDLYTANVLDRLKDLARIPHPSPSFDKIKVFFPYKLCRRLRRDGKTDALFRFRDYGIGKTEISEKASGIVMMIRPSMLFDLARVRNIEGGTVIYSMWGGYLKEQWMKNLLDFFKEKKMKLIQIHSTGHATIPTLKKVVKTIKPKSVIPIHTFHPDKYEELFDNVREVQDGVEIFI